jgi:hypothetical protein
MKLELECLRCGEELTAESGFEMSPEGKNLVLKIEPCSCMTECKCNECGVELDMTAKDGSVLYCDPCWKEMFGCGGE